MPKKRKNRGRHKGDKGKESIVYCDNCGKMIPRSKAVRVTVPYSPIPTDLAKELEKQGAIVPRYYITKTYCVNCAIYLGIIKVRSEDERKSKKPILRGQQRPQRQLPVAASAAAAPAASTASPTQPTEGNAQAESNNKPSENTSQSTSK
nr:30S ribosomal protein S26e [Caldivirga maquilingensis]